VIEVFINFYVLFINRNGVPAVLKRVFPILIGLLPGIAIGAIVVASVHPGITRVSSKLSFGPVSHWFAQLSRA